MKAWLAAGFGLIAASAMAQEFVAPQAPRNLPVVSQPIVAPPVTTEGIVEKIFNVEKPWQLVNPLAPKSYGNGGPKTVSYSENDPGKPKGFILFGIEFW
jgi:hypothetical protein